MLDHYSILDVDPDASQSEIRRAFRRRAKELHPDTNRSRQATHEFQRLQEAYRILQRPRFRMEYDASRVAPPQVQLTFPEFGAQPNAKPLVCRDCRRPTAQPRYGVYWAVVSNLVYATRWPKMGMFCASCARKASMRASLVTAAFGWWSLPGFVLAPLAIFRNARGGERPRGTDGVLLWNSALLFYRKGNGRIAKGLARQLIESKDAHGSLARNMLLCLDYLQPHEPGTMRDAWAAQRNDWWKHAALALMVPGLVAFAVLQYQGRVSQAGLQLVESGRVMGSKLGAYVERAATPPAAQAATTETSVAP